MLMKTTEKTKATKSYRHYPGLAPGAIREYGQAIKG